MVKLTVIIPTYNPRLEFLGEVLNALSAQTFPLRHWELLIIDNGSSAPVPDDLVNWHPQARVIRESRIGLTYARLRGVIEARAEYLVWVDDDNILANSYLSEAYNALDIRSELGAAGGASIPRFESSPPSWYIPGLVPLGCRDLGTEEILMSWDVNHPSYPSAAPIGAGLVIRKQAIKSWADSVEGNPVRLTFGRRGAALSSGEDNDINLTLLREGWELAYLPQLRLKHIIPEGRLTLNYQKRIARASYRDFVRVLDFHGIRPWSSIPRWSVPLRAIRTWLRYRAWSSPPQQVRWFGAIGQYEARASLSR